MQPFTLNIGGEIRRYDRPQIMGILNVTPDSFYSGSHNSTDMEVCRRVEQMVAEGADFIDVGGYSSRPGAAEVTVEEEMRRVRVGVTAARRLAPQLPVSVDTFRAVVARMAVEECGADIVNDISGGALDGEMASTVAALRVPYILMHMRGTPATMQTMTGYSDVTADVIAELQESLAVFTQAGVGDLIIDPGFGFAKTLEQNYELMRNLPDMIRVLGRPVLVGVSRKSMITRLCGITAEEALPGTVALDTFAVLAGASFIRVHDVGAAVQAMRVTLPLL